MKVTVTKEYNLPKDKSDKLIDDKAMAFYLACIDFIHELRSVIKYGNTLNGSQNTLNVETTADIRSRFYEILNEHNIDLDELGG